MISMTIKTKEIITTINNRRIFTKWNMKAGSPTSFGD